MSDQITDAMRQTALGEGLAAQAALAKRMRQHQLNAMIEQASGVGMQQNMPTPQMAQPGMSQADFSGYGGAPQPPEVQAARQAQLAELLRRRGQGLQAPY